MASYTHFIIPLQNPEGFFERLEHVLRGYCARSGRQGSFMADAKRIRIEYGHEDYYFYIILQDDDWIQEEMVELANHSFKNLPEKDIIAQAKTRIEFYGEDDYNMDYFNEFLFIMEAIQASEKVLIFDYQSGIIF